MNILDPNHPTRIELARAYEAKCRVINQAGANVKSLKIAHICATHELESDEFYTREQKAERYL